MAESPRPHDFVAPEPEEIAQFLPAYEVQAFIAKGGMGAVYMARQKSLDRQVAIKILPSHFGDDAYLRSQFESEAKNMAKLNHPNVISVHDFGEFEDQPYIIMEMVRGKSLYHSARGKRVDPRQAGRIIRDICHGLAHAHEQGILHRDLKPANVLLDPNRTPKIGDFGLARHITDHAADKAYGTPGYTAPEVSGDRKAVDESTDIYSVGVMLYELLSGKLPEQPYIPVASLAKCDPAFDHIILKAIDPSPARRYRRAEAMAKAIDEVIKEEAPLPVAKKVKPVVAQAVPVAKIIASTKQVEVKPVSLKMARIIPEPTASNHSPGSAPKKLIVGPIRRGQTVFGTPPIRAGYNIFSNNKVLPIALILILIAILTVPIKWLEPVTAQLRSMFVSGGAQWEKKKLMVLAKDVKAHLHEVELIGQKGDTGLVNLDGEKTLDWVVFTGANVSGKRDQMPERAYRMNPSSSGNFKEAVRKGIPVFFEAGGKELTPMAATSAKAGKAKAGQGWNISLRVPSQHKGSMLVTLYMFQEWCAFDVEVTMHNGEKIKLQNIPKQDPGVLRIPIEIPKVRKGKFYQIKITASKDTTGDFSMGLNAVHVEGR